MKPIQPPCMAALSKVTVTILATKMIDKNNGVRGSL